MKKQDIEFVREKLLSWGRVHYCRYPWRDIRDPWLALLAELLLQRTNAKHVARYFQEISSSFPHPRSVLEASDASLAIFEGKFGLDRRLQSILAAAAYLDSKDIYPTDYEALISVYGIGHYTASAYLSLHMNVRAVLIDSNVSRWLARFSGNEKPHDVRHCPWLWKFADELTPARDFKEYNYAVLDFTMNVCKPGKPKCEVCPLAAKCHFWVCGAIAQ